MPPQIRSCCENIFELSIVTRDVNAFFLPLFFFKYGLKKTVFFASFVASGNADCALLFPGF